jgi:hypothetical protein
MPSVYAQWLWVCHPCVLYTIFRGQGTGSLPACCCRGRPAAAAGLWRAGRLGRPQAAPQKPAAMFRWPPPLADVPREPPACRSHSHAACLQQGRPQHIRWDIAGDERPWPVFQHSKNSLMPHCPSPAWCESVPYLEAVWLLKTRESHVAVNDDHLNRLHSLLFWRCIVLVLPGNCAGRLMPSCGHCIKLQAPGCGDCHQVRG